MRRKYLFVGPSDEQVTGQSIIFNQCFKLFVGEKRKLVNAGDKKLKTFLCYFFNLLYMFFIYRPSVIYFTSSRSKFGCIRDLILLYLFSFRKKVRIVNHLHGADFISFRKGNNFVFNWFLDAAYTKIDVSIVLSDSMREQYDCYPKMDIEVIPNFSMLSNNNFKIDLKNKPLGRSKILFLSNILESKGIFEIVHAVKKLNLLGFSYHLDVAGSFLGDINIERRFFNETRGVDFIKYHGLVSGDAKTNLLINSDILALPTYYPTEAQPVCLIEGMLYGCYILTTRHSYIPDFISEDNGKFVSPKSSESIVKILSSIDDDEKFKEIQLYNIQYSNDNFNMTKFMNDIGRVLR